MSINVGHNFFKDSKKWMLIPRWTGILTLYVQQKEVIYSKYKYNERYKNKQ